MSCSGGTWPYSATDLRTPYNYTWNFAVPLYIQGVWALNSANDLYEVLFNEVSEGGLDLNLYIADVDGTGTELSSNGDAECNWYSWAALNDVIDASYDPETNPDRRYTGIFIGPSAEKVDEHWACTYKPWVERARLEAAEHPNIVKVIELDEVHRLLDGPDTSVQEVWRELDDGTWDTESHWRPENVEALHDMVSSGLYNGPEIDINGDTSPDCELTGAILSGDDLELWSRIAVAEVPRFIVPSSVLGMPGDHAMVAQIQANNDDDPSNDFPLPPSNPDYAFSAGDYVHATWERTPPPAPDPWVYPMWTANLEFFYVVAEDRFWQGVDLKTLVNGVEIPALSEDLTAPSNVHDYHAIYHSSHCIGGPGCISTSPWDSTADNDIEFRVQSRGSTVHSQDRVVYVWGARLSYDTPSTTLWETDLFPYSATYGASTNLVGTAALYQSNSDWRITNYIDGLTMNSEDYTDFDASAWDAFMENTCDYLHGFDNPKRCLLDERGSLSSYKNYDGDGEDFDLSTIAQRLPSGDTYGDGVMVTWLPTPIPFADNTEGGRFGAKDPLDSSYQVMLYEPRQSRSIPGETHKYIGTVPTGAACSGTYTVDWDLETKANSPEYHWYVEHKDVSDSSPAWVVYQEDVTNTVTSETGSVDVYDVEPGDQIRVRWVHIAEGGGPYEANYIQFRVTPPDPACAVEWVHETSMAEEVPVEIGEGIYDTVSLSPTPTQVYDCITEYFTTGSCTP